MIRVAVVDDQQLVREGFAMILSAQPDVEVAVLAEDGRAFLDAVRADPRLDVALVDVRMPVLDGLAATRLLAGPEVSDPLAVIVLTTFDLDEYVYEALRAGAAGFLLKDTTRDELAAAVRLVAGGDALLAPTVTRRLIAEFARRPQQVADPAVIDPLTDREREVLVLIARGRTNAEIAGELYVGEATVKTHVNHLFAKLHLRDRVQAVILAYELGLVAPGEQTPSG